ncbi:MAG: hypothetical protein AAFR16_06380, partial [Pseudomonadota bacterium]
ERSSDPFALEGMERLGALLRTELARAQNGLDAISILRRHRVSGRVACEFFSGDASAPPERRLGASLDVDALVARAGAFAADVDAADPDVEPPVVSLGPRHRALLMARRGGDPGSEIAYLLGFHNFRGDDLNRTRRSAFRLIAQASRALAIDFGECDPED